MARKWQTDTIIVEDKGNGTSYIQNRGGSDYQARKAPCPVVGISVDSRQGKAVRFDDVTPMIEEGSVYLPTHADWVGLFIREVSQFPEGNHDDQVDAMSQYLRWIRTKRTRFGTKKAVQG
jgi:predicted phage terminase large subunit-like protein